MDILGLFPLHIVLFPEASYPLHIFEERYKTLISEALEHDRAFGINLVEGGKMYDVGCRVRVTRVLQDYPDGRRDIMVTGTTRYRVRRVRPQEQPYITAGVEDYVDTPDVSHSPDDSIKAITLYNEMMRKAYGETAELLDPKKWLSDDPTFYVARKSGLSLIQRQRLLESRSRSERLQLLSKHLEDVLPKLRRAEMLRQLSRNDGYLPQ